MSVVVVEVLVLLVLVVINGVFALSELALVSARKARLQERADGGSPGARAALTLTDSPSRFLSTVQIGITLVGVLAGAFGGATLAELLGERIASVGGLEPYGEAIGLALVVAAITYLSLVIGELVPKRLALQNPERIAALVARPMQWLSRIAAPVVWLLTVSSGAMIRLLGVTPSEEPPVTEEEIRLLVSLGTKAGVFRVEEQRLIESAFRLDHQRIESLMTPHTEVVWLNVSDPPETIRQRIADSEHSRFPVARGSLDQLIGVVEAKTMVKHLLAGQPLDLIGLAEPPQYVPENATAARVLSLFRQRGGELLLVIDEHGSIQGVITEHDVLKALAGPDGSPEPPVALRPDGSWLVDGLLEADRLKSLLGVMALPDEERGGYQTLGGFVMHQLGVVPTTGQVAEWGGFRFEVVDMDGRRVDRVLIARVSDVSSGQPPIGAQP